jgi:hypothetical protein
LQEQTFRNVEYSSLRIGGQLRENTKEHTINVIADVAKQHESQLLWQTGGLGLVPKHASFIVVDCDGHLTPSLLCNGTQRSKRELQRMGATFSKIECSEHLNMRRAMLNDEQHMHEWAIKEPDTVKGTAGEVITLECDLHFTNPLNAEPQLRACRHCGAFLFHTETSFCCNNGKNVLPNHHFEYWQQPHALTYPQGVGQEHQDFFDECKTKFMKDHSRLCNNSLAFTMLKRSSSHGTAHELDPQYYPWMVSIQGRTYHTYLNTPQPYNNPDKPDKRLNNNIGWCTTTLCFMLYDC